MEMVSFTEEQISEIKEKIGYSMETEEIERFKRLSKKKSEDLIAFAKLVIYSYEFLENLTYKLEISSDGAKEINRYLYFLESSTGINILKQVLFDYGYGNNIGDFRLEEDIKRNLFEYSKVYKEMIKLAFRLIDDTI